MNKQTLGALGVHSCAPVFHTRERSLAPDRRTTTMRRLLLAFGLLGGLVGTADVAVAQDCIQDQYGRIVCGQRVRPQYAPEPRYYQPAPQPYYQQREQYRGGGYQGGYQGGG